MLSSSSTAAAAAAGSGAARVTPGKRQHGKKRKIDQARPNCQTMKWSIPNFLDRPELPGEFFYASTVQRAHGIPWRLKVYPRDNHYSNDPDLPAPEEQTFYVLEHLGNDNQEIIFRGAARWGRSRCYGLGDPTKVSGGGSAVIACRDRSKVIDPNSKILDRDGTLTLTIDLDTTVNWKTEGPKDERKTVWHPSPIQRQPIVANLFLQSGTSDVVFEVYGHQFPAHKAILSAQAPFLYEICEEFENGATVPIHEVSPDTFRCVLEFVYTLLDRSCIVWKDAKTTEATLVAADRLGCTGLKLLAESILVEKHLNYQSCGNLLLLADAHSCPLLKEAALQNHTCQLKNTPEWESIAKSPQLVIDLKIAFDERQQGTDHPRCHQHSTGVDALNVTTLRDRLENAGLDLDGDRETLAKRFQEYCGMRRYRVRR